MLENEALATNELGKVNSNGDPGDLFLAEADRFVVDGEEGTKRWRKYLKYSPEGREIAAKLLPSALMLTLAKNCGVRFRS
ncbi:hypothetical protein KCP73_11215 [Salmonella enterica subsp. enterica]|nr:hypothetical protein KCP73_11215 [Salmonella enterica subsp. enterica]